MKPIMLNELIGNLDNSIFNIQIKIEEAENQIDRWLEDIRFLKQELLAAELARIRLREDK